MLDIDILWMWYDYFYTLLCIDEEIKIIVFLLKQLPIMRFISGIVVSLASPRGLSLWWNLGSLLGILIIAQILTGWLLTLYYINRLDLRFVSVWLLHLERWNGRVLHWVHINVASFIFFFVYLHVLKGIHFQRWKTNKIVWRSGFVILVLLIGAAFLGYVLPFGQMRLWGATVITNLLRVVRVSLVVWIWGGYRVNTLTLNLFFTLHYLLPFLILILVIRHLWLLHFGGSTHFSLKGQFWPVYMWKDRLNLILIMFILWWILVYSYITADVENFILANPSIRPLHIKPEWYFLTYYAILRSIPNKSLGVFLFALRLFMLMFIVLNSKFTLSFYYPSWRFWTSYFIILNFILMLVGGSPVETPFLELGQVFSLSYFFWFVPLFWV